MRQVDSRNPRSIGCHGYFLFFYEVPSAELDLRYTPVARNATDFWLMRNKTEKGMPEDQLTGVLNVYTMIICDITNHII